MDARHRVDIYDDLRADVLALDPGAVGISATDDDPTIFGVVMETGFPEGVATLVALIDGTTSLYLSSGGGTIGGGDHPEVAVATLAFVRAVAGELDCLEPDDDDELPAPGRVILRALTYDGRRAADLDEDDLGNDRHTLSPAFHLGHEVIALLRASAGG